MSELSKLFPKFIRDLIDEGRSKLGPSGKKYIPYPILEEEIRDRGYTPCIVDGEGNVFLWVKNGKYYKKKIGFIPFYKDVTSNLRDEVSNIYNREVMISLPSKAAKFCGNISKILGHDPSEIKSYRRDQLWNLPEISVFNLSDENRTSIMKGFSFTQKFKSGLKSAWAGGTAGAIFVPGNIILALCGKKKAALILTGIGAGVGAGIGFYLGWNTEEYTEKLKNNPKLQKEKEEDLKRYIKDSLSTSPYPRDFTHRNPEDYRNSGVPYRPDFYKYLKVYDKFCRRYYREWIEAFRNLRTIDEMDVDFEAVFPTPYLDDPDSTDWYIAANGMAPSDHYWIAWEEESGCYNNDLGSGKGTGKTLLEASQNFAAQWISPEEKISDPNIREVARIHNKIIREFLKLK